MSQAKDSAGASPTPLAGRRIIVGVSGGIAAYKSPILVRRLRESGAEVQVVTTRGAGHFVTTTSLQAVSGHPVRSDLWDERAEASMGHIELARWADLIVIAPATADLMSRLAAGRADDLLTTLRLATRSPVLLAPAMNVAMWEHPATRRNLAQLQADGCLIAGPEDGSMACGEFGPGRMMEPEDLVSRILAVFAAGGSALAGRHVVITAGPTREAIDPVRYISNHSSGKQGYALAAAALEAGARVTLISGPVALTPPPGATVVDVISARDMHDAALAAADGCDVFIGVAAVADYRPAEVAEQKIKKRADGEAGRQGVEAGRMNVELVENPDIIASIAAREHRPYVVGFAAETQHALEYARAKRERKGLDLMVVNDVSDPSIGFSSDDNAVTLISADGERELARADKLTLARAIIAEVAHRLSVSTC